MITRVLPAGERSIAEAAEVIRRGGLVSYPTDTLYGLGADCGQPEAVEKVFVAKGRPTGQPLPVLVASAQDALKVARDIPIAFWRLAAVYWPGALTLVLRRRHDLSSVVTAGGESVAVRAPDHPVAYALIVASGTPITGTSANRSGSAPPLTAKDVLLQLDGLVDVVLDGGRCPGGVQSTILDLTTARPRLVRQGAIALDELQDVLGVPIET